MKWKNKPTRGSTVFTHRMILSSKDTSNGTNCIDVNVVRKCLRGEIFPYIQRMRLTSGLGEIIFREYLKVIGVD